MADGVIKKEYDKGEEVKSMRKRYILLLIAFLVIITLLDSTPYYSQEEIDAASTYLYGNQYHLDFDKDCLPLFFGYRSSPEYDDQQELEHPENSNRIAQMFYGNFEDAALSGDPKVAILLGDSHYLFSSFREVILDSCQPVITDTPNYPEAFRWYTRAAEAGDPYAIYMLAEMKFYGEGLDQSTSEAFSLYQRSARFGSPISTENHAYVNSSLIPMPEDVLEELLGLRLGALNGEISAMDSLGLLYLDESLLPRNPSKALYWLERSANHGSTAALKLIAEYYLARELNEEPSSVQQKAMHKFNRAYDIHDLFYYDLIDEEDIKTATSLLVDAWMAGATDTEEHISQLIQQYEFLEEYVSTLECGDQVLNALDERLSNAERGLKNLVIAYKTCVNNKKIREIPGSGKRVFAPQEICQVWPFSMEYDQYELELEGLAMDSDPDILILRGKNREYKYERPDSAMVYYQRAAVLGSAYGHYLLAEYYYTARDSLASEAHLRIAYDLGFESDLLTQPLDQPSQELFHAIRKDALRGDAEALRKLGISYALGKGVERDFIKAQTALEAASQNSERGRKDLARFYTYVHHIQSQNENEDREFIRLPDEFRNMSPWQIAVEKWLQLYREGDAEAAYELSLLAGYSDVIQDSVYVGSLLLEAAHKGHRPAQVKAAKHVLLWPSEDWSAALRYYQEAARNGNSFALTHLSGTQYLPIYSFVSDPEYLEILSAAAINGCPASRYFLGARIINEKDRENYSLAVSYLESALEAGYVEAGYYLAKAAVNGLGREISLEDALRFLDIYLTHNDDYLRVEDYLKVNDFGLLQEDTHYIAKLLKSQLLLAGVEDIRNEELGLRLVMEVASASSPGWAPGYLALSYMYLHGIGVEQDVVPAIWFLVRYNQHYEGLGDGGGDTDIEGGGSLSW